MYNMYKHLVKFDSMFELIFSLEKYKLIQSRISISFTKTQCLEKLFQSIPFIKKSKNNFNFFLFFLLLFLENLRNNYLKHSENWKLKKKLKIKSQQKLISSKCLNRLAMLTRTNSKTCSLSQREFRYGWIWVEIFAKVQTQSYVHSHVFYTHYYFS